MSKTDEEKSTERKEMLDVVERYMCRGSRVAWEVAEWLYPEAVELFSKEVCEGYKSPFTK